MHGGALALAAQAGGLLDSGDSGPDVFLACDMLDLPVFLATLAASKSRTTPVGTGRVPSIVYFHENQLTYPLPPGVERDLGYGFKNLTTAVAGDVVLFNSEHHRSEFLGAVDELLAAMPDAVPAWAVERVAEKSRVLPLACDLRELDGYRERAAEQTAAGRWGDPAAGPLIVWNQRWEYDKAPGELFRALEQLRDRERAFRLAVAGSGAVVPSREFERARSVLADRVVHWGRIEDRSDYAALLWAGDIVVSTAIHEFFGVAVLEAVYCGCRPVLPARLSYPELIPAEAHGEVLYGEGEVVDALARALAEPHAWSEDWQRTWAARFDWGSLKTRYDEIIGDCAAGSGARGRRSWTGFR
jgi:glycosyltransferase involved in cell wall biosynthesis